MSLYEKFQPFADVIFTSDDPLDKTFRYDESLPSLPVPDLQQTLDKYLKSIKLFVSEEEFEQTCKITENFKNGVGNILQEKLKERAKLKRNWLEEWWMKYAYLSIREPLAPCINMGGLQSLHFTIWDKPSREKALEFTATSIWGYLRFFNLLREERMAPQKSKKNEPLSMHQFRNLFNTTRIPKEDYDELISYFKTKSEGSCPRHLIILCHGHIWYMDPWDSEGNVLTVPEIEAQLRYVKNISESLGDAPGISALTADNREIWAKNRRWLTSLSETNEKNLSLIESAVSIQAIDEAAPLDINEAYKYSLCGEPQNRWADKSHGGIVFETGYIGNSNDHTPYDAMVMVVLGFYQHELITEMSQRGLKGPSVPRELHMPKRLIFDVDDFILNSIEKAKELNSSLRNNLETYVHIFTNYGKNWMKETKCHPDSFVQCALQLAYYLKYKKFVPTYETAQTRRFYKSRTETVRSCNVEVAEWVQSMLSSQSSIAERKNKLIHAVNTHRAMMVESENGQGIDRHLLGLSLIAYESDMEIPEFFMDPAYVKSGGNGNYVLSTSTIGYSHTIGGVGPMVPDGYGVFYSMLPERIMFVLTAFQNGDSCCKGLSESLTSALLMMQKLFQTPQSKM